MYIIFKNLIVEFHWFGCCDIYSLAAVMYIVLQGKGKEGDEILYYIFF